MLTFTLRKKLVFSFSVLIIISFLALGVSSYNKARDGVLKEMKSSMAQTVKNVNDYYLDNLMKEMEHVVNYWAQHPEIVGYENAPEQPKMIWDVPPHFQSVTTLWKGYMAGNPDIAWMYLGVEKDGSILLEPLDTTMPADYDCRTREWYQETLKTRGKAFWTEPYLDAGESGEIIVTVSRTVRDKDRLIGVVGMDIKLQKFSELIKGIYSNQNGYLMLMSKDGKVYAHPNEEYLNKNLSDVPWVKTILNEEKGTDFFEEGNKKYIYSFLTVPDTGWKLVGVREVDIMQSIVEVRTWTLDSAVLAALFILITVLFVTKVFLKPLRTMMRTIDQIIEGKMDTRMEIQSKDEFGVLSEGFNKMVDRITSLASEKESHVVELIERNKEILRQKSEITALCEETEAMNEELTDLLRELRRSYLTTVTALANAIEASDQYTKGHCERVRTYAVLIAKGLEYSDLEISEIEFASMLHDVGKIGVSNTILNKSSKLTIEEYNEIKKHPTIGAEIIAGITFLENCRTVLRQHHERIDGRGYPDGLKGELIHPHARILAIADAYDAMTSARPYRSMPLSVQQAIHELELGKGIQFDEYIVTVFIGILRSEQFEQSLKKNV